MFRVQSCAFPTLLLCLAPYTWADSKIVAKTSINGRESVVREYRQGRNFRIEDMQPSGNAGSVTIFNFDKRAMYRLDEQAKQYTEMEGPDVLAILAAWIRRTPQIKESGKAVNVYYETIDTGERRQQFGFTARHLIMHERHIPEPGACSASFEIDRDGWYFVPSHLGSSRLAYTLIGGAALLCHDTVVQHGHPAYPGFPIQETTTTTYSNPAFSSTETRELIEYSTEPLDKSLLEIPKQFKRIELTSWSQRFEYDWSQLEEAAASWFQFSK